MLRQYPKPKFVAALLFACAALVAGQSVVARLENLPPGQDPLFTPGSPVTVGAGSGKVLLLDVNGDGRLDLLTQHLLRSVVAVQIGDGTGRFVTGSSITLGYQPGDIKLGDVNGDKILDLVVTRSEPNKIDIFFGNGRGGFSLAPGSPFTVSTATEFYTYSLQLVDLNEDGNLDIVTANNRRNTCASLLGNGRGGFAPGPTVTFPAGHNFYSFAFGDVDGDGHLDIATASGEQGESAEPGRVTWLRGDGKGASAVIGDLGPGLDWWGEGEAQRDALFRPFRGAV